MKIRGALLLIAMALVVQPMGFGFLSPDSTIYNCNPNIQRC